MTFVTSSSHQWTNWYVLFLRKNWRWFLGGLSISLVFIIDFKYYWLPIKTEVDLRQNWAIICNKKWEFLSSIGGVVNRISSRPLLSVVTHSFWGWGVLEAGPPFPIHQCCEFCKLFWALLNNNSNLMKVITPIAPPHRPTNRLNEDRDDFWEQF